MSGRQRGKRRMKRAQVIAAAVREARAHGCTCRVPEVKVNALSPTGQADISITHEPDCKINCDA